MDQNRYVAPDGTVYVASYEIDDHGGCNGCAFLPGHGGCMDAGLCNSANRGDGRDIIWVREQPAADLAPREALLAHIADLTAERDELRTSLAEAMQ